MIFLRILAELPRLLAELTVMGCLVFLYAGIKPEPTTPQDGIAIGAVVSLTASALRANKNKP